MLAERTRERGWGVERRISQREGRIMMKMLQSEIGRTALAAVVVAIAIFGTLALAGSDADAQTETTTGYT